MSSSNRTKFVILFSSLILSLSSASMAYAEETPSDICKSAAQLFEEGDIEGALEEARWCVTQLEQLKQGQTAGFFKDEVAGYSGGELNSQQTMGMSILERNYTKDGAIISVSMSGGAAGNAMNSLLGSIASMGMQSTAGKKIRIQRRTAMLTDDNGSAQIVVTLKSGGILTFSSDSVSGDDLLAFAEKFPVADLDDSLG